jgi:hypothetical protein
VTSKWLDALQEEVSKHNTAAALRERHNRHLIRPVEILKTPINPPSKTSKTPSEAEQLGLVATWSVEFGYVGLHDPTTGEWHDVPTKEAPSWAMWEARKRKELYKDGNRKAYRLTSRDLEKLWAKEHPDDPFDDDGATDERGYIYEDYLEA